MKQRFQFGAWLCGLGLGAALLAPWASAQNRPSNDRPPARQQQAPHPANRPSGSYHPQGSRGGQNRPPVNQAHRPANNNRPQGNANNPGASRNDRTQNAYRQQTPATPPPNVQERWRNMTPQERSRLAENQKKFNQLPPQRQQEMRQAAENWKKLTPEQQSHIKNDLNPKWQQMSPDRQKAISNRLAVLRNMPESARNRHLSDPSFTRGMSDEDREMLRDLSHEHVGAPDRPQEQ